MVLGDKNLQLIQMLGQGTFGRVFLCSSKMHGEPDNVCVKRIIVADAEIDLKMILEEIYIISQIQHPNIVKFLRSFVHAGTFNIVMEYVDGGTLRTIIQQAKHTPISAQSLLNYFCDILMGLEYLHIRHVIHRDLKPENLLLNKQHQIKIADFGIAAVHRPDFNRQHLAALGTPFYTAPEILLNAKSDFKADIWSLGCVLYELCLAQHPFAKATNMSELKQLICERTFNKEIDCQHIAVNHEEIWACLCRKMLVYNPLQRIALPDILCVDSLLTIAFYKRYFDYKY